MKLNKIDEKSFWRGFSIACFIIISFTYLSFLFEYPTTTTQNSIKPDKVQDIIDSCSNMSMYESALCVNNEVKSFYKYNISNKGKTLSFKELKEQGGVCSHYTDLYCDIGEELGFNTEDPVIKTKTYHTFCIWSNEDGYIIIDQTKLSYTQLRN